MPKKTRLLLDFFAERLANKHFIDVLTVSGLGIG